MAVLTAVLFLQRSLAQDGDGKLKREHTDVASPLTVKRVGGRK
jgi:hypothetical protein